MLKYFLLATLILCASAAFASSDQFHGLTYEGTIHNDEVGHRASLSAYGKIYWLDFRGVDLYHVAQRFDREHVVVRGSVGFPQTENRPVIYVDSITFRPFGRALTYRVNPQPRVIHRRVIKKPPAYMPERPAVREYDYDAR